MKVAVIEKRKTLGGTCLNIGCIPSKALLHTSEKFENMNSGDLSKYGIDLSKPKLNISKMMENKNKISTFYGNGHIDTPGEISVSNGNENKTITSSKIMIATGSLVAPLKNVTIDEKLIVSSTGALDLKKVPNKLIVVGGGYIGLEMGTVWRRLGSQVTVVEYLDRILPGMDSEIAQKFKQILQKQGIDFKLNTGIELSLIHI